MDFLIASAIYFGLLIVVAGLALRRDRRERQKEEDIKYSSMDKPMFTLDELLAAQEEIRRKETFH